MKRLPLLLLLVLPCQGHALVTLAPLFQDRAVLQCDKEVPVWGEAAPGEPVEISFGGQTLKTKADAQGRWLVRLAPLRASSEPAELRVKGSNVITLREILVGEVWLCSGQSNMEFPMRKASDAANEMRQANFPAIREFKVAKAVSGTPLATLQGAWTAASPQTVGDFSAVGYFFARAVHARLNVPVGIVNASYGGTMIEAWVTPETVRNEPVGNVIYERWKQGRARYPKLRAEYDDALAAWEAREAEAKTAGRTFAEAKPKRPMPWPSRSTPAGLFNAMVHPLAPYALRGILWYQGEANVSRGAREYRLLFPALITRWREAFAQGDLPFYWVQLPNFSQGDPAGTARAALREAQQSALTLPQTAQAVTIDIGDPANNHPENKQEVGRRLALLAGNHLYGWPDTASGPEFARAEFEADGRVRVRFVASEEGLVLKPGALSPFELAGADRVFHPAEARVEGGVLVLSSCEVAAPKAVRYAWCNAPEACLFNRAGLPAAPFRSDA